MIAEFIKCDECEQMKKLSFGQIPPGWVIVTTPEAEENNHYCSRTCVVNAMFFSPLKKKTDTAKDEIDS